MEIKQSIFRRKSAKDPRKGKWVVRLIWEDAAGRERTREQQFKKRSDAIDAVPGMKSKLVRSGGEFGRNSDMTFADLVAIAKADFYHPATYERGLQTGGVKSYSSVSAFLDVLSEYFGEMKIGRISAADIRKYREWRLKRGNRNPSLVRREIFLEVSPATINRELSVCRRLLNYAHDEGWLEHYVFRKAKAIHKKFENPRQRVLTHEELDRLIAACEGSFQKEVTRKRRSNCLESPGEEETFKLTIRADNPFMKPMILLAADSGLRRGEILSLTWADLDLERKRVTLRREVTKTEKERVEGLTDRTIEALNAIKPSRPSTANVFPAATERSWKKIRSIAGLEDIRFHDLRRTASTVLVRDLGLSVDYAAKLLGHEAGSAITLQHYVAVDEQAIDLVTERLNDLHRRRVSVAEVSNAEN